MNTDGMTFNKLLQISLKLIAFIVYHKVFAYTLILYCFVVVM